MSGKNTHRLGLATRFTRIRMTIRCKRTNGASRLRCPIVCVSVGTENVLNDENQNGFTDAAGSVRFTVEDTQKKQLVRLFRLGGLESGRLVERGLDHNSGRCQQRQPDAQARDTTKRHAYCVYPSVPRLRVRLVCFRFR